MSSKGIDPSHSISRQVFDLQCPDAERGRALLELVEGMYADRILPVIEAVLDAFAVEGEHLEIDHLELDLGDVAEWRLEQELPQLVELALRKRLQEIAGGHARPEVHRKSARQGDWEALTGFLETGLAPWWTEEAAFKPWELLRDTLTSEPHRVREYLVGLRRAAPGQWAAVLARIAGSPDPAVVQLLLRTWLGEADGQALESIWAAVAQMALEAGAGRSVLWRMRAAMLEAAVTEPGAGLPLLEAWVQASPSSALWATIIQGLAGRPTVAPEGTGSLRQHWQEWLASKTFTAKGATPAEVVRERTTGLPRPTQPPGEAIFVTNAGLALVAGFLPAHFGHLDLLDASGQFHDADAQMLALRHVEVLARGLHPVDEHAMALTKLLVGLDLAAPVDMGVPMTTADLEAADGLLQAVIGHWPVVGDIVPDQLRGGFLLRDGWLQQGQTDWTLRVERKTYDVVLQQLPWSIGMIALPWLRFKVWVEW